MNESMENGGGGGEGEGEGEQAVKRKKEDASTCYQCRKDILETEKGERLSCQAVRCARRLCASCSQEENNISLFSCFNCTTLSAIPSVFCEAHILRCQTQCPSDVCFEYICRTCQMNGDAWPFEKCSNCRRLVCTPCVRGCAVESCKQRVCRDCFRFCKVCNALVCHLNHNANDHPCRDALILELLDNLSTIPTNTPTLQEFLFRSDACTFSWSVDVVEAIVHKTLPKNVFAYRDEDQMVLVDYDAFVHLLDLILDGNLATMIKASNGIFSRFRNEIHKHFLTFSPLFYALLQQRVLGYVPSKGFVSSPLSSSSEMEIKEILS
jgi:hypothetical protein